MIYRNRLQRKNFEGFEGKTETRKESVFRIRFIARAVSFFETSLGNECNQI